MQLLTKQRLVLFIGISLIVLIWSTSIYLVRQSDVSGIERNQDLGNLLFGASSIALFIFSILIAILALVGWQSIMSAVRDVAKETATSMNKPLENELRGRVFSGLGYMLGEMSLRPGSLEPIDKEKLEDAIQLCQQGYDSLKKTGINGPQEILGLNNLVYYGSLSEDRSRSEFWLDSARRLMKLGQEHDVVNLQLTACRAILQYSAKIYERRHACTLLEQLAGKAQSSVREKREAQFCLISLCSEKDKLRP
jgi:hypothetical protein